jgi:beta-glucanase (GH16 family)
VALSLLLVAGLGAGCGTSDGQPESSPASVPPTMPATASPAAASPTTPAPTQPAPTQPAPSAQAMILVPPSTGPTTWTMVWSDEFDGPAGAPPDPDTWGYDLGDGSSVGLLGWGNRELEDYTADPANASTDGKGHLVLTVRRADGTRDCWYGPCEYTSARLLTKGLRTVQYGRIEARIKVPGAAGLWPAFWMLGDDIDQVGWPASGEIDVMEFVGRRPDEVLGTIHGPGYSGSSGISGAVDLGGPVAEDFHAFSIDWRPDGITWRLDGEVFHVAHPDAVAPNPWVFDHPFFVILNVAVGGNLGGPVAADAPLPQSMLVDYVRVYQETPS